MKAWIQLGKHGDILSILPIIRHEFQVTGQRQPLMVAHQFKDILAGCSYIEPVIWNGSWADLAGAILKAKKKFSHVVTLSSFGGYIPIQQRTPSFQLDHWFRGGCLHGFHEWPLVFDQRSPEREQKLVEKHICNDKVILLADYAESFAFRAADEIAEAIKKEFAGRYRLLRLSEVRAEYLFDLLGLYDNAVALVTGDTAHLHLAHASNVPKFVFAVDDRGGWGASAYRTRFNFYRFYSEAKQSIPELLAKIHGLDDPVAGLGLYHVWTCGKVGPREEMAATTWAEEGKKCNWIDKHFDGSGIASLGNDSHLPRIHAMIDHACKDARDHDVILLTNADTCIAEGFVFNAVSKVAQCGACFCYRYDFPKLDAPIPNEQISAGQWYPGSDAFAFTKGWWYAYRKWYPDMVVGREWWDMVMRNLIKLTGGRELEHGIYHERHAAKWEQNKQLAGNVHNAKLAGKFINLWSVKE